MNGDEDDPTRPPHGGPSSTVGNPGSASMEAGALAVAVHSFLVMNRMGPPMDAAAFGIACGELMQALNISLNVAALLLRVELERRGL